MKKGPKKGTFSPVKETKSKSWNLTDMKHEQGAYIQEKNTRKLLNNTFNFYKNSDHEKCKYVYTYMTIWNTLYQGTKY